MEDVRTPKAVFLIELPEGEARSWCSPRKRHKDQLKSQLAQAGISQQSWQQEASDRDSWRSSVRNASRKFEAERHEAAKERHRRQIQRAASQPSSAQTLVCPKRSRATNNHTKTDHQPSPKSSFARNHPSSVPIFHGTY